MERSAEEAAGSAEEPPADEEADVAPTQGQLSFLASDLAKAGDLTDVEEARLQVLRHNNLEKGRIPKPHIIEELHLRARKRKSMCQDEDDHVYRSHTTEKFIQFVKIARTRDGDPWEGVPLQNPAAQVPAAAQQQPGRRSGTDTLAEWKSRCFADDFRFTEMCMTHHDATYGNLEEKWELFFMGPSDREVIDAGRNPVAPGVHGAQDPFLSTFFPMYTDNDWQPEHMFPTVTALKDASPQLTGTAADVQYATQPPSWECLRLLGKNLFTRVGALHHSCQNYSGDSPPDDDKIWSYCRGDSGCYYAYLRTKDIDDFYKMITQLDPGVGDESGFAPNKDTHKHGHVTSNGKSSNGNEAKRVKLVRDQSAQKADDEQASFHKAAASAAKTTSALNLQLAIKEAKANYTNEDDADLKLLAKQAYMNLLQQASTLKY